MPNCKTAVPYRGTPEQEERLRQVIEAHKGQPGATMPVLQAAQEIFGYLPEEVQIMVAEGLDLPLSEIYGVASFYSFFTLNPKGKYQISVCLGTACYVKGAADVLNAVEKKLNIAPGGITGDGLFSLDACRCIGACGLAPVMMINDDVYGRLTAAQVGPILDEYIKKGMKELSLHLLDVAKNSTAAGAKNVSITLDETADGWLTITIADDGRGMAPEFLAQVTDPFTTTRTTRKVGLGLPLLRLTAEQTGGSLSIESTVDVGTTVTARFCRRHLDCPPLGDMAGAIALLIQGSPDIELIYRHTTPRGEAALSTAELREILGDVSLAEPEVFAWIQEYLAEQEHESAVEAVPAAGIEGEII